MDWIDARNASIDWNRPIPTYQQVSKSMAAFLNTKIELFCLRGKVRSLDVGQQLVHVAAKSAVRQFPSTL
jgi:hypothetical protein